MSALAKIHIAKSQLGLDDDTYRDLLERVTGRRSAKGLEPRQTAHVLDEFTRLGWVARKRTRATTGQYLPKVQALWIAGWNLGIVRNRTDAAMNRFIKRQTGIDHPRWLIHGNDAARVIEALKGWLEREAQVDWSAPHKLDPTWMGNPRYRIVVAQWSKLRRIGAVTIGRTWTGNETGVQEECLTYGAKIVGTNQPDKWSAADWIAVMNALGRKLRKGLVG